MTQTSIPLGDTAATATAAGDFAHLPLERVWADPDQPRRTFDEAFLVQLADSIKMQGVIQPIVVRPTSAAEATYTIISGESRWRASQMAGKDTIPALIRRDLSESDIAVMQILENLQRRDLSLIDTCEGVTRLVREIGLDKTADQLGMSKSWVSRHSTLAELPMDVLDLVKAGQLESIDQAKDLAELQRLNAKEATTLVRRLRGEIDVFGQSLAAVQDDAERSEEERQEAAERRERLARPPTRVEIRAALSTARQAEAIKRQAVVKRQASKNDPAAIEAREAEKAKAAKQKADAERRKAFKQQAVDFEQLHTTALSKALGLKVPKRQDYGWPHGTPAVVRCRDDLSYQHSSVPAKFETLKFGLHFTKVDVDLLRQIKAAGYSTPIKMEIEWGLKLTVEQAEAISKILGSKAVAFSTDIEAKANEVPAFVARFEKRAKVASEPLDGAMALNKFIDSRVRQAPDARVKAADFHALYEKHCKAIKVEPLSLNSNQFGAVIDAHRIEKKRLNTGWHYLGIEVKA